MLRPSITSPKSRPQPSLELVGRRGRPRGTPVRRAKSWEFVSETSRNEDALDWRTYAFLVEITTPCSHGVWGYSSCTFWDHRGMLRSRTAVGILEVALSVNFNHFQLLRGWAPLVVFMPKMNVAVPVSLLWYVKVPFHMIPKHSLGQVLSKFRPLYWFGQAAVQALSGSPQRLLIYMAAGVGKRPWWAI